MRQAAVLACCAAQLFQVLPAPRTGFGAGRTPQTSRDAPREPLLAHSALPALGVRPGQPPQRLRAGPKMTGTGMWVVTWALSLVAGLSLGVLTTSSRYRRPGGVESEIDRAVREFYTRIRRGKCVVMFTATWCGPCKLAGPLMNSIQEAGEYPDMDFMKIDIGTEEGKVICAQYGVKGLPTFVFFNEGEPFGTESMGARAATTLAQKVRELDEAASPSLMLAGLEL